MKISGFLALTSRGLIAAVLLLGSVLPQSGLASPTTLMAAPGQSVTVSVALNPNATISGAHVMYFVAKSTGAYTGLKTAAVANFTAGQSTMVSATLTLPATFATGTYYISAGIYSSTWAPLRWVTDCANLTVSTTTSVVSLSISGKPATSVNVGSAYSFRPTDTATSGAQLTFSIANKPVWASFDTTTGTLTGTPTVNNVGSYANIIISVTDGTAKASLAPFTLTVNAISSSTGTATLQWIPPTENTDGSVLTDLAGYKIYYGTSATALTQSITITNPGLTAYTMSNLSPGTWYFVMTAYSSAGVESVMTPVVATTL